MIDKPLLSFVILIVAGCCAQRPLQVAQHGSMQHRLNLMDYFAKGTFFGLALLHFLPEALASANQLHIPAVWVMSLVAFVAYVFQFSEQGVLNHRHSNTCHTHNWCHYVMFSILILHSVIEGAVLGLASDWTSTLMVALGILAHKGAAAYALSSSLCASGIQRIKVKLMMSGFVLATPLSIGLMTWLSPAAHSLAFYQVMWWLQALAAGAFLYVATGHHLQLHTRDCHIYRLPYVLRFGIGLLLMVILSFWHTV